jgi:hypothetical protein
MIRALLLIVDGSRTWEKIKNDQHSALRVTFQHLLPLLLLTTLGEGFLMWKLGVEKGTVNLKVVSISNELLLRYELVQFVSSLIIVLLGSVALQKIGESFHRKHTYAECLTTLGYSLSSLFLMRLVDGIPAVETWLCYGAGIFLALSILYRGIPFILRPDPSNALGLFVFCSFLLLSATGLAHWLATLVLDEKLFA